MRFAHSIPAVQLRSVALRYRREMLHGAAASRRHWLLPGTSHSRGSEADSSQELAKRQRVEAVLLLAREPLNSRKLAHFARLADGTEARTLARCLNRLYDETGRAFRIEEIAGGFRLLTRRQFAPWLRRLEHVPSETRLSAPAMETLAVVAYRQPVLRADIESVRGVSCGEILRQLMERDLVRIGGRSDELGRPYLYTTTRRFLQLFGLQNLEQLPRVEFARPDEQDTSAEIESTANHSPIDQSQEEITEVTTTSINPVPANEPLDESTPLETEMSYDDEIDDLDFEDDDDDEDEKEEELDWDEDMDDDFDESEWEEVDDDDDDDDDWEDDEDDDWGDEEEDEAE